MIKLILFLFIFIGIYYIITYSITCFSNVTEDLSNIKFAIVIPTFYRNNGKTIPYLKRSIESIISQEHKYWDIILVGDKFEPEQILLNFINEYNYKLPKNNKIIYLNNPNVERDYITNKHKLWLCAGATSVNMGLKYCRENNYKYYCHLDDDDYWSPKHLLYLAKIYNKYPNCIFANTQSSYLHFALPEEIMEIYENNRLPISKKTIHSSISFRTDIIPFDYDTSLNENGIDEPSDSLLLDKIKNFLINNKNYSSIYIPSLTCYHDVEGELK
jgi:glycosyltransferase involved in cell wall biosynthesis